MEKSFERNKNDSGTLDQPFKEIFIILFFGLALFTFLSLITSDPHDLSIHTTKVNEPIHNAIGFIGAWFSHIVFFLIGLGAYLIPFLLLFLGLRLIFSKRYVITLARLLLMIPFLIVSAVLLSFPFWNFIFWKNTSLDLDALGYGGILGYWLYEDYLFPYLGYYGSLISLGALWLSLASWIIHFQLHYVSDFWRTCRLMIPNLWQFAKSLVKEKNSTFSQKDILKEKINLSSKSILLKPVKKERAGPILTPSDTVEEKDDIKLDQSMKEKQMELIPVGEYILPQLELLIKKYENESPDFQDKIVENGHRLQKALQDFGVDMELVHMTQGPVITRYELQPAPGVKVQKILTLSNDIALALKSESVRIIAPIPGKSHIGIEVPNPERQIVSLYEIMMSDEFRNKKRILPIGIGKDVAGDPIVADLADMPHLLVAGATGTGKSICLNAIIINMLYYSSPNYLKFLMIDPKRVELSVYNKLPHLVSPVITDPKLAVKGLSWVVREMERRYRVYEIVGVRHIVSFNNKVKEEIVKINEDEEPLKPMPYIVVIIDELADLMLTCGRDVENSIARLAQLSRAVGIHLIIATQRPSVDIITGIIKANFPTRLSFQVSSKIDSRTILDSIGAEALIGKGDMLFSPPEVSTLIRIQGSYISDAEIRKIVKFIEKQNPIEEKNMETIEPKKDIFEDEAETTSHIMDDELFQDAVDVVLQTGQASVSILQRRLRVGYTRAARLMDLLEERGIVGPYQGSKAREILVNVNAGTSSRRQ